MRHRLRLIIALLLIIGFSATGLARLRFETDILNVLPNQLPSVKALKVSQEHFDNDQTVVMLVHGESEIYEEDMENFAAHMRDRLAPAKVLFKSELEEDPTAFGEALADIWRFAPARNLEELTGRLNSKEILKAHLEEVKAGIERSFDQQESTVSAYDPLGFLKHPAMEEFIGSDLSFQSDDGKFWLILIENPEFTRDYQKHAAWLEKIRNAADTWLGLDELGLNYGLTGGPVYNAEIGAGMEKDMTGTISLTCGAIAILFLVIQRRPEQLVIISVLLGLTFFLTLGVGGWFFGSLNLVSVGFAAILLGLVIDYGVVIAREASGGTESPSELRRKLAPAIGWAAFTTAIVFGLLTLSTFNGVRQLGGLIVIGILAGAAVMLVFMPMLLGKFHVVEPKAFLKPPFVGRRTAILSIGTCGLFAAGIFTIKGKPDVNFDFSMVEPSSSEAAATFSTIQKKFPAWSDRSLHVVAHADSWQELRTHALLARKRLETLKSKGIITAYQWPVDLIPRSGSEHASALYSLAEKKDEIMETMRAAGFSDAGIALDRIILERFAKPPSPINKLSKHFVVQSLVDGNYYLSGSILTADKINAENVGLLKPLSTQQFQVTGWSMIQAEILPYVKRDFYVIFLPASAVLMLTLMIVFRSVRDAAISIAVLMASLAMVNAFVVLTGRSWNFLSGIAIPLIIGTGIDYSIHLIFALRRSGGDIVRVWNGVGKAICFCGISTAVGFGSLLFASNETLRSMGLLCSLGVLLTTLLSVLVVPGLWQRRSH